MVKATRVMRLTPELVARVPRFDLDKLPPGPERPPDSYYEETARDILAKLAPGEDLWVFAFGSLLWKPSPEFDGERRPGVVRGWHRAFCLGWDDRFRGNPDHRGLMLSLDRGGQSRGVALRIRRDDPYANLLLLLKREPPFPLAWVNAVTADGPLRAISFAIGRKNKAYVGGLSNEAIADALALATGEFGSMAEYLHNTVQHLEDLGIHDTHLWAMQELVAERLERLAPVAS